MFTVLRVQYIAFNEAFHRFVEVYIPDHGWLPIDVNREDSDGEYYRQKYFLGYDNNHLKLSRTFIDDDDNLGLHFLYDVDFKKGGSAVGKLGRELTYEWTVIEKYLIE